MALTNCPRCHGDIMYDSAEDEYLCIMCARRYARIARRPLSLESELAERKEAARGRYGRKDKRKFANVRVREPSVNGVRI